MARLLALLLLSSRLIAAGGERGGGDSLYALREHHCAIQLLPTQAAIACTDSFVVARVDRNAGGPLVVRLWRGFSVDSCRLNGRNAEFDRDGDRILVRKMPGDTVASVVLAYTGTSLFSSEYTRLTPERAILRMEEILPYVTGPQADVLRSLEVSVAVPRAWQVAAPGDSRQDSYTEEQHVATFRLNQPVPLLGWICAGPLVMEADGPITAALYPEDSLKAGELLGSAAKVLRFFSDRFRPFRYSRLTIVETEDWVAGPGVLAIAMPAMIMVKKRAFTTDIKFDRFDAILPHEIAHQWWAMTVFVGDEDNALLSEGLCEFSALLYGESSGAISARDSLEHHPLLRPLILRAQENHDRPLREKADLRTMPTQYLKAMLVQHMLRKILGDSVSREFLHRWAVDFADRFGTQDDFRRLAEKLAGRNLGWFFDQWTARSGIPRLRLYNVKASHSAGKWLTTGRVRLVGYDHYTLPVDIRVVSPVGSATSTAWLGFDSDSAYHNDVGFSAETREKPTRVVLDPYGDILKGQKIPVKLSDLREPGDAVFIVGTQSGQRRLLGLARADSAALVNAGWSVTLLNDSEATLADFQHEKVFIYGRRGENVVLDRMNLRFPITPRGDTLVVNGETLADTSLALVEAVESGYAANGMIVWIAPLGAGAHPELLPFESSWVVLRGKEEIVSGTWEVRDPDLDVAVP